MAAPQVVQVFFARPPAQQLCCWVFRGDLSVCLVKLLQLPPPSCTLGLWLAGAMCPISHAGQGRQAHGTGLGGMQVGGMQGTPRLRTPSCNMIMQVEYGHRATMYTAKRFGSRIYPPSLVLFRDQKVRVMHAMPATCCLVGWRTRDLPPIRPRYSSACMQGPVPCPPAWGCMCMHGNPARQWRTCFRNVAR